MDTLRAYFKSRQAVNSTQDDHQTCIEDGEGQCGPQPIRIKRRAGSRGGWTLSEDAEHREETVFREDSDCDLQSEGNHTADPDEQSIADSTQTGDHITSPRSFDGNNLVSQGDIVIEQEEASQDLVSEVSDREEDQSISPASPEAQAIKSSTQVYISRPDQLQAFHQPYTEAIGLSMLISDDLSVAAKVEERHLLALHVLIPEEGRPSIFPSRIAENIIVEDLSRYLMPTRNMRGHEQTTAQKASVDGSVHLGKRPRDSADDAYASKQSANGNPEDLGLEELQNYIERLQARASSLSGQPSAKHSFRYKLLYRILKWVTVVSKEGRTSLKRALSSAYFDPPEWWSGENGPGAYRCSIPVDNLELYLEKNKDIAFLVYETYLEPSRDDLDEARRKTGNKLWTPVVEQSIRPISEGLTEAVSTVLESRDVYTDMLETFRTSHEVTAPYIFCYHHRSDFEELAASSDGTTRQQLQLFLKHIVDTLGDVYNAAAATISQGKVSLKYLDYLFKPGDTLVMRDNGGQYTGWIAEDWAQPIQKERVVREKAEA